MGNAILQQFDYLIRDCQPLCIPVIFRFLQMILLHEIFMTELKNALILKTWF